MNTIRSVGYGWGILCLAGGGSYYFAKRSINADREARAQDVENRRQHRVRVPVHEEAHSRASAGTTGPSSTKRKAAVTHDADNPSPNGHAAAGDPAPVTHEQKEMAAKGKYEAAQPFRSTKGDRFS
ncbi:hypothetical protein LTR36_004369 [Oleoguttula mirabilis]|uniref:Uncharacterized protein n=1 Tax=Oleoguttula mirabilis TaxID=1507867 RepID=A0AAV9JGG3_9PEZI|nr:hypothetical protein LTR36_004369 [Oleoguttula mirabilis]